MTVSLLMAGLSAYFAATMTSWPGRIFGLVGVFLWGINFGMAVAKEEWWF